LRRGDEEAGSELHERLDDLDSLLKMNAFLTGREYGIADAAYLPWILRARGNLGIDLEPHPALADWVSRATQRPSVAAESELLAAL
jgi:glutathione S-transferase